MEDAELVYGAVPLDGVALDIAGADGYGSREEEEDIASMMMLNGYINVEKTFQ